jgi:hypothetical protein
MVFFITKLGGFFTYINVNKSGFSGVHVETKSTIIGYKNHLHKSK